MFKKINKTIFISGMKCEGCATRVQKALSLIDGVKSCVVSLENGSAVLTLSKDVSDLVLQEIIENLGFQMKS